MKKFLFRTVLTLNIVWGVIFFICSCFIHYVINNDGEYNCDVDHSSYSSGEYPTLFGSKTIAYYSAFCFLNPDDSGGESDTGMEYGCGTGGGWQTILILPWLLLWVIPLYSSREKNFLIIIPTVISGLGIMFMYQLLILLTKHTG